MLKIKDGVDLKELEKYGFKKANYENDDIVYTKEFDDETIVYVRKNKEINYELDVKYADEYILCNELITLYDLIKADLVEKSDK